MIIIKYTGMIKNIMKYIFIYFIGSTIIEVVFFIARSILSIKYNNISWNINFNNSLFSLDSITKSIGVILTIILFILMFRNKKENLFQRCRFKKISLKNIICIILLSIAVFCLTGSCLYVGSLLLNEKVFKSYIQVSNNLSTYEESKLGIIYVGILAPIIEEIVFRGLIFNELRKNINIILSIIIQAGIFAMAHGNIVQGVYVFASEIIVSLVYIWTKSIISNIILHISFNLYGLLIGISIFKSQYLVLYVIFSIVLLVVSMFILYKDYLKNINSNTKII